MATGDGPTPDYLDSVNQQSLTLECSVCAENYGPEFDNQPRSLRCGHTFCTKCLMKIMTSRGVRCPMCNSPHNLTSPDVMLLPINYTVQEIMKTVSTNKNVVEREPPELPPCGVCPNPATVICVDCEPGNHFNFCAKCDNDEHGRPFGPVQRHRRFPIDKAPSPNSYAGCSRHPPVTASFFSEILNEFACNVCVTEEDWASRNSQFDLIVEATKRLQGKVQKLTKYTTDTIRRMNGSKQTLETILSNLEPTTMEVKADITTQFSKLIEVLQERQRILLANVDIEHKNRIENVETQLKVVVALTTKYRDAFESLNSLISKTDIEFLRFFPATTKHIESLLDSEDKSLLRPVVNQHIPFYINKDVEKEITSLGAVGGGFTPTDLGYSPSGSQGSLLELFWQLPEHCGKLSRFQIEYDQITVERRGSGMVMESDDLIYAQSEPQFYEVPGNKLNTYMDYLCPGYNYQFRIRSANDAGWGMWSKPIVGKCEGFPFTLEYTKSIHRVVVPISSYYRITVKGAKGEDGMIRRGGKGAIISATFFLKAGDILILLCGGMSSRHHYHSGGGGGSFLALNEVSQGTLLIAAGGGGGTRGASEEDLDGSDASIYPDGKDGLGEDAGSGGVNGAPGEDARDKASEGPSFGNGGAGFMQDSSTARSLLSGGHGGQNGGFGGGGAVGMYGGGGGGGYSGGGGGRGGGGGGSYVISTALDVTREVGNDKHGSVTIDRVMMPPYPMSNVCLGQAGSVGDFTSASDCTETSSSSQQINPFPQMTSSSVGSGSNLTSNPSSKAISTASIGTSIGTVPETSHESPASTSQVIDQARYVPATFSIGSEPNSSNGNDDTTVEILPHGDSSGGVGSGDPSELDASALPGTRMPASLLSEFMPTLEEYIASSQAAITAATAAAAAPAMVRDLINLHQQEFLRETSDSTLTNEISPEEKALIAKQLIQQQSYKVSQSQSQLALISTESPLSVKPSKSIMYQQQQQQPLVVGMSPSSPTRPTKHTTSPSSGIGPAEQSTTSQSPFPMQQQFTQDHYQQQLAEMQRYIQSQQHKHQQTQASQQVHQQNLVQGGGQDDFSTPLTLQQQQQHVLMHQQQQLRQQQPAQLSNVHQPASQHVQQQLVLQQQQQQQLQMQAGICDDHSQHLLLQQQLIASASQPSTQPPNNGIEISGPGQFGQQPAFDYAAHPNWNAKN